MFEETQRLRKRQQIETAVTKLSGLAALLFSAWVLYHFVMLALSGLTQLMP